MVRRIALCLVLLLGLILPAAAQEAVREWYLGFSPALSIPLGSDTELFTPGGAGLLTGRLRFFSAPAAWSLGAGLGYGIVPVNASPLADLALVHTVSLDVGGGFEYALLPRLLLGADLRLGLYLAFLNLDAYPAYAISSLGSWGWNPLAAGSLGLTFLPIERLRLGLEVTYRNFFGFYRDLLAGVNASYRLPKARSVQLKQPKPSRPELVKKEKSKEQTVKKRGEGVELGDIRLGAVFPVFFKFYDRNSLGRVTLTNAGKAPAEDVSVELLVKQYMDNPKECAQIEKIQPGESREVELTALFNNSVLDVFEDEVVSASLTLYYTAKGDSYRREYSAPLRLLSRNALSWDDDRKAAAFVNAKDPEVLVLSKAAAGVAGETVASALNPNLLKAVGVHEALRLLQVRYVPDPSSPYKELSQDRQAVDFLQFPRQTLKYRAGDCDDLTILFCALLESVGVETAFITVPGHIYAALSLGLSPAEALRSFQRPEELISSGDKSWLPLEVSEIEGGFLKAWQTGAKQWRENLAKDQARLWPVHEAWMLYEAVGYRGESSEGLRVDLDALRRGYRAEVTRFVEREIYPQVARLQGQLQGGGAAARVHNSLGVLYAGYAQFTQAEREFSSAAQEGYVPALVNLGTLYYLSADLARAQEYYERASAREPANAKALLGLTRVQHEQENFGAAQKLYDRLKAADPSLAARFTYLGLQGEEASRAAAAAQVKGVVAWSEE